MNDKEDKSPGAFASMGGKLDRLIAKMQEKVGDVATRENMDKLNSSLRNAGENVQESLSRAADKAGAIWKDSRGTVEGKVDEWRKEHEGEIRDFTTRADGWIKDQKGNIRGALDKLLDKIQNRLKKS